jgi:hypothetical protein
VTEQLTQQTDDSMGPPVTTDGQQTAIPRACIEGAASAALRSWSVSVRSSPRALSWSTRFLQESWTPSAKRFRHEFDADGAKYVLVEVITLVDLFLLGQCCT